MYLFLSFRYNQYYIILQVRDYMSGFITIYNTDQESVDRSLIYSLTQKLKFRGPDQQQVWVDGHIGM